MTIAQELRDRVTFSRRAVGASGRLDGAWGADAITVAARLRFLHGGEGVLQQRIQGTQPVVMTIRTSAAARAIDNTWRAVNTRTGQVFNVTATEPTRKGDVPENGFLDVLATWDGSSGGS